MLREKWTLAEIHALPAGEHDFFDRKSGKLLNENDFQGKLGKALSGFANSGGGHVVLGVEDNGDINGVPKFFKDRTDTREWLEQIIPNLVEPETLKFRVHLVEYGDSAGNIVIVIDIGDSFFAPFQVRKSKLYFYRAGGHSKPAPHFYLEAIRNRQRLPALIAVLTSARIIRTLKTKETLFVQTLMNFDITNVGGITPTHWIVDLANNGKRLSGEGFIVRTNFPTPTIVLKNEIHTKVVLPSQTVQCKEMIGFHIPLNSIQSSGLQNAVDRLLNENIKLNASVITNINICEESEVNMQLLRQALISVEIVDSSSEINARYSGDIGQGLSVHNFSINMHNTSINNVIRPGDHIQYLGIIENKTENYFKDLIVTIVFRNDNGKVLSTTNNNIGLLAPLSQRPFNGFVEANEIWFAKTKEFYAYESFRY